MDIGSNCTNSKLGIVEYTEERQSFPTYLPPSSPVDFAVSKRQATQQTHKPKNQQMPGQKQNIPVKGQAYSQGLINRIRKGTEKGNQNDQQYGVVATPREPNRLGLFGLERRLRGGIL